MDKKPATDIGALIEKMQKDMDAIDLKSASSAQLSGLVEDFKTLETALSETDEPMIKMLGGLLGVGGREVQAAYEDAQVREGLIAAPTATPSAANRPSMEDLQQRIEQLDAKIQSLRNMSDDDITPELLKDVVEEGRALKKDIDATDNPFAHFLGGLLESESLSVLEEIYEELLKETSNEAGEEASVSTPADKGPQPTLFEVRQIFTKLQAKMKKVLAKGEAATTEETNEVVDLAKVLNNFAQANPNEQLSGVFTKYLQGIKLQAIQEFIPQPPFVTDDDAAKLLNGFNRAFMVVEGQEKEDTRRQDVLTLIEEYKKIKNAIDTAAFESEESKRALQEVIDDMTLEDLQQIHDEVVLIEAKKHPDLDRFVELQENIKQFETKMNELKAKRAASTSTLQDFQEVIQLGDLLKEYADAHPSRIGTMIIEMLEKSAYHDLKKAYTETSAQKTFINGKFDLFEEGFVGKCQEYFEDLAVNSAKKSKKFLQEAAQVMKGLPEDFKGLKAESAEEKEFIDNLPGQTTLLSKIIERELKLKEKAAVKKAPQKQTKEVPSVTKKATTKSAKKTETTKATKKRVKV